MTIRINAAGLLEVLHSETGGYVPANTLLQVEGGLLASLVPEQIALLSDIQVSSKYLKSIEAVLIDTKAELASANGKLSQSNTLLVTLNQINTALDVVTAAIDSLEILNTTANTLLGSVQNEVTVLSSKIPATLGAKTSNNSLSVALATDSTIFASLSNLVAALSSGDSSVHNLLIALSNKIPASLGIKTNANSLSVGIASDSDIFSLLTNLLNVLSDGVGNSTVSYLNTVASAQFWKVPVTFDTPEPIINAATVSTSSAAYNINPQAEAISLQNFFSAPELSAQFAIELRATLNASSLHDKTYYYRGDTATPFAASAGAYAGESPIIIATHGHAQVVVHLSSIAGAGNVTTYLKEIK